MVKELEDSIFILPERVNFAEIESLKDELKAYAEKNSEITLDASIVQEMDAAGFQIILSLQKYCVVQSKPFTIIDASNHCRKVLELCGLIEILIDE